MGLKTKLKRFFDLDLDDESNTEINQDETASTLMKEDHRSSQSNRPVSALKNDKKVVSLQTVHLPSKVMFMEPQTFADVETMTIHVKSRRTVIINLDRVSPELGRRILDFLSGATFALDGHIQKLAVNTFMFAPEHVDITKIISDWEQNKL
ncbi:DUF552 domain-containing protein [Terrilactibacillus sp. BCM23-1]|uniref:Cell division protein SepF n=1 Tax=Terrilactibacillus tamarindi TaxID=2599694 RepID=A0A6N8CS55_9BACI|nr:cell division protein SepF [Terrilactibacillus tamarindi]MTT32027.1 DUF552 domain-containing protein [Terrilactibacillus tamarindi]